GARPDTPDDGISAIRREGLRSRAFCGMRVAVRGAGGEPFGSNPIESARAGGDRGVAGGGRENRGGGGGGICVRRFCAGGGYSEHGARRWNQFRGGLAGGAGTEADAAGSAGLGRRIVASAGGCDPEGEFPDAALRGDRS